MKVAHEEILFIKRNAPAGFPALIKAHLDSKGIKKDRAKIHTEISTIKKSYNEDIINAARKLLKDVKGLVYN